MRLTTRQRQLVRRFTNVVRAEREAERRVARARALVPKLILQMRRARVPPEAIARACLRGRGLQVTLANLRRSQAALRARLKRLKASGYPL